MSVRNHNRLTQKRKIFFARVWWRPDNDPGRHGYARRPRGGYPGAGAVPARMSFSAAAITSTPAARVSGSGVMLMRKHCRG